MGIRYVISRMKENKSIHSTSDVFTVVHHGKSTLEQEKATHTWGSGTVEVQVTQSHKTHFRTKNVRIRCEYKKRPLRRKKNKL